jgi:hypothetical protein
VIHYYKMYLCNAGQHPASSVQYCHRALQLLHVAVQCCRHCDSLEWVLLTYCHRAVELLHVTVSTVSTVSTVGPVRPVTLWNQNRVLLMC